jgi:hypothetical protein
MATRYPLTRMWVFITHKAHPNTYPNPSKIIPGRMARVCTGTGSMAMPVMLIKITDLPHLVS